MLCPNTSWPRLLPLVLWYVERTAKSADARIPIHGSASFTYVSCRLYFCARFLNTLCILYLVAFVCGLPGGSGLVLITYSLSINRFLNS